MRVGELAARADLKEACCDDRICAQEVRQKVREAATGRVRLRRRDGAASTESSAPPCTTSRSVPNERTPQSYCRSVREPDGRAISEGETVIDLGSAEGSSDPLRQSASDRRATRTGRTDRRDARGLLAASRGSWGINKSDVSEGLLEVIPSHRERRVVISRIRDHLSTDKPW